MRRWNIHECHAALKTKPAASPKVSGCHPFVDNVRLAFNKVKPSTYINIKVNVGILLNSSVEFQMTKVPTGIKAAAAGTKHEQPK